MATDWTDAIIRFEDVTVIYETEHNKYRLDWVYLDEGWYGDYNPDDPTDEPLIRFDVYVWDKHYEDWNGEIDGTSYCTQNTVGVGADDLRLMGLSILERFADVFDNGGSGKYCLQEASWLTPDSFLTKGK